MGADNPRALKHMYGADFLQRLVHALCAVYPRFDRAGFLAILPGLGPLEMKGRVHLVRDRLHQLLPADFPGALRVLRASMLKGDLRGFDLWPFTEYVQKFGIGHPELARKALRELTPRFTSEWAVRPFIRQDPKATLDFLLECAQDEDEHVRRWASEGSRSRLPWGERLACVMHDPNLTAPILEALRDDPSLYVRKSVANHLNDISKDHPAWAIDRLRGWLDAAAPEDRKRVEWIATRALRSLIKAGDVDALSLFGAREVRGVTLLGPELDRKTIRMGEDLRFTFTIESIHKRPQKLVVDYVMHFRRADGRLAPKVFKLCQFELAPGETREITKKHPLRAITTRTYHKGAQRLEIQVNGRILGGVDWRLGDGSSRS